MSERPIQIRVRRVLGAMLLLVVALAIVALPAAARPAPPTASATFQDNGNCTFTVTYAWSGFKGRGLTAYAELGYKGGGGLDLVQWYAAAPSTNATGGSFTATFTLSGTLQSGRQFFGAGELIDSKGHRVSGSYATNGSYSASQACGNTASIS